MLPETERGLLPRPGRRVRKLTGRRPKDASFWAGNPGTRGEDSFPSALPKTGFDAAFGAAPIQGGLRSAGRISHAHRFPSLGGRPALAFVPTNGSRGNPEASLPWVNQELTQ